MKIMVLSNVSIGYGSPQIPAFLRFLMAYFGAEGILVEPDQPQRPSKAEHFSDFSVRRMLTKAKPWAEQFEIEYVHACAKEVNRETPDVLVLFDPIPLPVVKALKKKPPLVIYYCLEMVSYYEGGASRVYNHMHHHLSRYADLMIFAEETRRQRFIQAYGEPPMHCTVYNCANTAVESDESVVANGRILYQGTIDQKLTLADYYLKEEVQHFPIDLYGLIEGETAAELKNRFSLLYQNVRYLGYVPSKTLAKLRKSYAYGLVSWNPISDNFLYAAPNKFFEYIQDGVVPIAAPHPQCKHLIEKYKCGILMDDWSFDALLKALSYAQQIYETPVYEKLVENCKRAWEKELNWDAQMKKVAVLLVVHQARNQLK